jgi:hypothetical protein
MAVTLAAVPDARDGNQHAATADDTAARAAVANAAHPDGDFRLYARKAVMRPRPLRERIARALAGVHAALIVHQQLR